MAKKINHDKSIITNAYYFLSQAEKRLKFLYRPDEKNYVERIMVISPFYTQNVLKAYSQHLSVKSGKARVKKTPVISRDQVEISTESKNKYLANKISQEIVNNLTRNSTRDSIAKEILNKLGQEFGVSVDVVTGLGQELKFKPLKENGGGTVQDISPAENNLLQNRIFDIARIIVYDHLSRGGKLNESIQF